MRFPSFLFTFLSTASAFHVTLPLRSSSTRLYAVDEIATVGSLGPVDFALFLVPVSALVVRASAINDRNELQVEIETSQKFLEDAKQRLLKVEEAIKVRKSRVEALEIIAKLSSVAGVLSFAFVLAFQLGAFSSPVSEPVLATSDPVAVVKTVEAPKVVIKEEPKVEMAVTTPKATPKEEPKVDTKAVETPAEEIKIKKDEKVEKIDGAVSDKKVSSEKKETEKKGNSNSDNDDEKDKASYGDLLKKLDDEPTKKEGTPEQQQQEESIIQEEKDKAEQKAKDFVELEGGML